MYQNYNIVGDEGASKSPSGGGLTPWVPGESNGPPEGWEDIDDGLPYLEQCEIGELAINEYGEFYEVGGPGSYRFYEGGDATLAISLFAKGLDAATVIAIIDGKKPEQLLALARLAQNRGTLSALLRETAEISNNVDADNADAPENTLLPYQPFPVDRLPEAVSQFVAAGSKAIGCDPAYIALPVLGMLARAIGNRRVIELKDTWHEPAIIWGAIVGPSGTHKSPAIEMGTGSLQEKESAAAVEYEKDYADYEDQLQVYESDKTIWSMERRKQKDGLTTPPPQLPQLPACTRYITSDCTIEALAKLLNNQSDGLLVVRDELAGWLGGIAEYKGGRGVGSRPLVSVLVGAADDRRSENQRQENPCL